MDAQIYPTYKVAVLAGVLAGQGIGVGALVADTGIDQTGIHSAQTRISRRQLLGVYRNAVRVGRDPAIGLEAGRHLRVTAYGIYGFALVSSATLREALEFSIRYHELATPTVRMSLSVDDDDATAIFCMEDALGIDELAVFNLELQFSLVFSLFRDMVGEDFRFDEILATWARPAHAARYEELFGCPLRFEQPRNELRFKEWWLGKSPAHANPITAEFTREVCDRILREMTSRTGIAAEVNDLLTRDLRACCDIESVAERLHTTPRTLRRWLSAQSITFQQLLQDVRREFAITYLRETRMSVEDIAQRLGFSDAANFRHAFKRWTGKAPSSYRTGPPGRSPD